jgi:hypothetical protein
MGNPGRKQSNQSLKPPPKDVVEIDSPIPPAQAGGSLGGPMASRATGRTRVKQYGESELDEFTFRARKRWLALLQRAEPERELATVTIQLARLDEAAIQGRPVLGSWRRWLQSRKTALYVRVQRG